MLTASELGISQAEYEALQVVRDGLASGEYIHAIGGHEPTGKLFNISISCENAIGGCGTVACIGGWVALTMGLSREKADKYVFSSESGPLEHLYFPNGIGNWDKITPAVAAATITSFLDSGEANFEAHL